MKKSDLSFIIWEYCSQRAIDITDEQLDRATEILDEEVGYWEEFNYRCGIYSVNVTLLLDNYFAEW